MGKRLFALSCIFILLFTANSWADEGLVFFKVVESPLKVQVSVKKINSSFYKIKGTVFNKGVENIYNSRAEAIILPQEGVKLRPVFKKLGTLKAGQTKKFSFNVSVEQSGTYLLTVTVSGFNKSGNIEHVIGAKTTFTAQVSNSFFSWLLKHFHF